MKARSTQELEVLKLIKTDLVKKEKENGNMLSEADSIKVLQKMAAQRKDSIEQFTKAGRNDLVEKEQFELNYISSFLPKEPTEEEVMLVINSIIDDIEQHEQRKVSMADTRVIIQQLQSKYPGYSQAGKLASSVIKRRNS